MAEEITHITINGKYRIVFEEAASATKGRLGFKVEANSDNIDEVKVYAENLLKFAQEKTEVKKE